MELYSLNCQWMSSWRTRPFLVEVFSSDLLLHVPMLHRAPPAQNGQQRARNLTTADFFLAAVMESQFDLKERVHAFLSRCRQDFRFDNFVTDLPVFSCCCCESQLSEWKNCCICSSLRVIKVSATSWQLGRRPVSTHSPSPHLVSVALNRYSVCSAGLYMRCSDWNNRTLFSQNSCFCFDLMTWEQNLDWCSFYSAGYMWF